MIDQGAQALVKAARGAAKNAHAPYSNFAVGAAVLLDDGTVVTGTNFENASYGLSLCAETVALATVNAQGKLRHVLAIAVTGGRIGHFDTAPVSPCGRCRQIINEAAQLAKRDLPVFCAGLAGDEIAAHKLSELLPHAFGPADLGIG